MTRVEIELKSDRAQQQNEEEAASGARNLSDLFTLCSGFQRCVASQQESPGPIHSSSAQTGKSLIFQAADAPSSNGPIHTTVDLFTTFCVGLLLLVSAP
jgi:hypothetical protein